MNAPWQSISTLPAASKSLTVHASLLSRRLDPAAQSIPILVLTTPVSGVSGRFGHGFLSFDVEVFTG